MSSRGLFLPGDGLDRYRTGVVGFGTTSFVALGSIVVFAILPSPPSLLILLEFRGGGKVSHGHWHSGELRTSEERGNER